MSVIRTQKRRAGDHALDSLHITHLSDCFVTEVSGREAVQLSGIHLKQLSLSPTILTVAYSKCLLLSGI